MAHKQLLILAMLQDRNQALEKTLDLVKESQIHEINRGRKRHSEYSYLFPIIRKYDVKFFKYMRMCKETFDYILSKIQVDVIKDWCNLHTQPILPEERLVITLRFLATGRSFSDLHFTFAMGISTISGIVKETVNAVWLKLYPIHMPVPTKAAFSKIAEEFYSNWNFPHCLGAIDGCHVAIKNPQNSGSKYFNYKKFFSIVLQAVVDSKYKFITIDVGGYGKQSDGGTFRASGLYRGLESNVIQIPEPDELPNSEVILPYFLVGDGAYPLMNYLMRPFRGLQLTRAEENFNKRLSRARMVVECAFGILSQKWQIYQRAIQLEPNIVESLVKCTCVLHNAIIDLEKDINYEHCSMENETVDQTFHPDKDPCDGNNQEYALLIREDLMQYLLENPIN